MPAMDLRQLRYFVAVGEELHFTRAAQRLHLAQSALSAQIRALEREVGAPLLTRSTRRVTLTPVGEVLLEDAREVLAQADSVMARARSVARREAETLLVGCLGAVPGELLTETIAAMAEEHPSARVEVHAFDFAQIQPSLTDARADVVFVYTPYDEQELVGITVVPLSEEPRVVVLSENHRLAGREALTPADLVDEVFVSHSQAVSQTWRDFWLLTDQFGGRRPRIHPQTADTLEEWLLLIVRGDGLDTAPSLVSRYYAWPGVKFVPLVGAPPATLAMLRRSGDESPLVDAFVAKAQELRASDAGGMAAA